jgi:hypothetical protein
VDGEPDLKLASDTTARQLKMIIDNSYVCQYCSKKFTNYFQYKSHMVIHKDEQVSNCRVDKYNADNLVLFYFSFNRFTIFHMILLLYTGVGSLALQVYWVGTLSFSPIFP